MKPDETLEEVAEKVDAIHNVRSFGEERQAAMDTIQKIERIAAEYEDVKHPKHYCQGGMEVIDIIKAFGYDKNWYLANVLKYVLRSNFKGKELKDLKKARHNLNWYIEDLEDGQTEETIEDVIESRQEMLCELGGQIEEMREAFRVIIGAAIEYVDFDLEQLVGMPEPKKKEE